MNITVKLFANLRLGRFDIKDFEYGRGMTVERVLTDQNIPKEKAAIIFVNNRHVKTDYKLQDGDVLAVFPPIGGG